MPQKIIHTELREDALPVRGAEKLLTRNDINSSEFRNTSVIVGAYKELASMQIIICEVLVKNPGFPISQSMKGELNRRREKCYSQSKHRESVYDHVGLKHNLSATCGATPRKLHNMLYYVKNVKYNSPSRIILTVRCKEIYKVFATVLK